MQIDTVESAIRMMVVTTKLEERDKISQRLAELIEARCKQRENKVLRRAQTFARAVSQVVVKPLIERLRDTDKQISEGHIIFKAAMESDRIKNAKAAGQAVDDLHAAWRQFQAS